MENKSVFLRETEAFIEKMQEFISDEAQPKRALIVIAVEDLPDRDAYATQTGMKGNFAMLLKGFTALLNDKNRRHIVMTAIHFHQLQEIMAAE